MKFKKILAVNISDSSLDKTYWNRLSSLAENFVSIQDSELKRNLKDVDGLLVPFGYNVDKKLMDSIPSLKYVGILATAYGKVDIAHAKSKNIIVCNLPGYSTEAVAEFVFSALLENMRLLEKGKIQARQENYDFAGFPAKEIKNKIFGILGMGSIGTRTAELALAFGAQVCYWSRSRKPEIEKKGAIYIDADELLKTGDIISLHFAETSYTQNFINKERIALIKKGAILINTSPMELIEFNALNERLKINDMTFILDHSDEMTTSDLGKLSKYKNCIIYPPIAYVSKEARIAKQEIFIENIENFLKGSPTNKVN